MPKLSASPLVVLATTTLLLLVVVVARAAPGRGASAPQSSTWYTVWYDVDVNHYFVGTGKDTNTGVAVAEWADERNQNGWTRLNLYANAGWPDEKMAFGSGYLEGSVTAPLIWYAWYNWINNEWNGTTPTLIANFFDANIKWMKQQVTAHAKTDPYWQHVNLVLLQLEGMQAGYSDAIQNKSRELPVLDFHILNAGGDLETIQDKFNIGARRIAYRDTHCSSLVKISPDLSEMYAGHTTWTAFYNMLRSYKTYDMPYQAQGTVAKSSLFSSYPASLSSTDDFYQLSSNLVVMETTNGVWNSTLYKYVLPSSVLSWIRVIVANRMAVDGKTWVDIFSRYNSGTYNNQWIVVDYNKFVPKKPLVPGILWIAEQIPGLIEAADMTSVLDYGYWPSYNIPYFPRIWELSGWNTAVKENGPMLTYSWSPRAQIFRRDGNNVKTMTDFMKILRYNNWKNDPLSYGDPGNQISSRFDLEPDPSDRAASGGIDSKVTSSALLSSGVSFAQSGPSHDSVPPFDWRTGSWGDAHMGLPDLWNFGWVSMPSGSPIQSSE